MIRVIVSVLSAMFLLLASAFGAEALPQKFDSRRDAAADVEAAVTLAKASGKRVLVDVGGEWCTWCHVLDQFIAANADVRQLLDDNYVWVKVNWSLQNRNEPLLSRWPKVTSYPHLFVLDAAGQLVDSQATTDLESGRSYDRGKVLSFLLRQRRGVIGR